MRTWGSYKSREQAVERAEQLRQKGMTVVIVRDTPPRWTDSYGVELDEPTYVVWGTKMAVVMVATGRMAS